MRLTQVELSDLDEILRIENECFFDPWSKDSFLLDIDNNDSLFIKLVDDNDKLIGYYDAWLSIDDADIGSIAVTKAYQGKGYGEKLLNDLLNRCKEKRIKNVHLEVNVNNLKAKNLYSKFGFKQTRIRKGYYNGVDAIEMVKGF